MTFDHFLERNRKEGNLRRLSCQLCRFSTSASFREISTHLIESHHVDKSVNLVRVLLHPRFKPVSCWVYRRRQVIQNKSSIFLKIFCTNIRHCNCWQFTQMQTIKSFLKNTKLGGGLGWKMKNYIFKMLVKVWVTNIWDYSVLPEYQDLI